MANRKRNWSGTLAAAYKTGKAAYNLYKNAKNGSKRRKLNNASANNVRRNIRKHKPSATPYTVKTVRKIAKKQIATGVATTYTKIGRFHRWTEAYKLSTLIHVYTSSWSAEHLGAVGRQTVHDPSQATNGRKMWQPDIVANQAKWGVAKAGAGSTEDTKQSQMIKLHYSKIQYRIRSACNQQVHMVLYDYVCKNDQGNDITPSTEWAYGNEYTSATYPTTITQNTIGASPMDSVRFRNKFKIIKAKAITLNPGQTHIHTFVSYKNWSIPAKRLLDSDADEYVRGLTGGSFWTISGDVIKDTGSTNITIGVPEVDYVATIEQSIGFNPNSGTIVAQDQTLATTVTLEEFIGDQDETTVIGSYLT